MLISPDYITANREMHERGNYGAGGHKWAAIIYDLARQNNAHEILDYGCGQGTLGVALKEKFDASFPCRLLGYDPAIAGKETKPTKADVVACTDVLEHVEIECLEAVLDDIRSIVRKAVFLAVATVPASKFLADGRNTHLIVESPHWWLPLIMKRFRLIRFTDMGPVFSVIGHPL